MSLLPYIMRDMARTLRILENQIRYTTDDLFHINPLFGRIPSRLPSTDDTTSYSVVQDKDKFQVKLNVHSFKPEEIVVKTLLDGNAIQIEAKQNNDIETDGGSVARSSRYFSRIFMLPEGHQHDLAGVMSSLSAKGVLTVTAPRKQAIDDAQLDGNDKEQVIPVTHVVSDTKKHEDEQNKKPE